jgi:hypothetical protein
MISLEFSAIVLCNKYPDLRNKRFQLVFQRFLFTAEESGIMDKIRDDVVRIANHFKFEKDDLYEEVLKKYSQSLKAVNQTRSKKDSLHFIFTFEGMEARMVKQRERLANIKANEIRPPVIPSEMESRNEENPVQCGTASSNLSEFETMGSIQEATGTSSRTAEPCNGKDIMPVAGKQQSGKKSSVSCGKGQRRNDEDCPEPSPKKLSFKEKGT